MTCYIYVSRRGNKKSIPHKLGEGDEDCEIKLARYYTLESAKEDFKKVQDAIEQDRSNLNHGVFVELKNGLEKSGILYYDDKPYIRINDL